MVEVYGTYVESGALAVDDRDGLLAVVSHLQSSGASGLTHGAETGSENTCCDMSPQDIQGTVNTSIPSLGLPTQVRAGAVLPAV